MSTAADHGELVEQLRHNVLELLREAPHPPRSVRVQAGEVSLDVEWGDGRVGAAPPGTAVAEGGYPPAPVAPTVAVADGNRDSDEPGRSYVTSPAVGTLYWAPEPGAPDFVKVGDLVSPGQQVAIVEVMKLMLAVRSEAAGQVVEVLKGNGEPVEFGERLIVLADESAA